MADEIAVKLSGDNSEFRRSMAEAVSEGQKYAGELGAKVADKVVGMRDVATAVATALGLNMENIAKNVAGLFVGMTEAAQEAYKKIGDLSEQVADHQIDIMRARLKAEDQLTLVLKDREKEEKQIEEARIRQNKHSSIALDLALAILSPTLEGAKLWKEREERSKAVVKEEQSLSSLVKTTSEEEKLRAEVKKKQVDLSNQATEYAKNEQEHAVKSLGYTEQRAALEQNVANAAKHLAEAEKGSVEEGKRRLELQKAQFALEDLQLKHEQEGRLAINEQAEMALLIAKNKKPLTDGEVRSIQAMVEALSDQVKWTTNISGAEHTRLQISTLLTAEKKNERDINEILKKGVENLSNDELHHLELMVGMNAEIDKQIAKLEKVLGIKGAIVDRTAAQAVEEHKITEEQQKQLDNLNKANGGVFGFTPKPLTHEDLANVSDEALVELIRRSRAEAQKYDPKSANFDAKSFLNAGSQASGFLTEGMNQSILNTMANAAQAELDLRRGIRSGDINVGNFAGNPLEFDRLFQDSTATDKVANNISNQLTKLNANLTGIHSGLSSVFPNMGTPQS